MKKSLIRKDLVIGIILLLIGIIVFPTSGVTVEQSTLPLINSNILYVGGSGPNNYTYIQNAIDNASIGDTVFVFDYSSPYFENIFVDKSINLIGENRNTTIIDGRYYDSVINISADSVVISGFCIQNSKKWRAGILSTSNNNEFYGNKIVNNDRGILLYNNKKNIVTNNKFEHNRWFAIFLGESCNNLVTKNTIINCDMGIAIWGGYKNRLTENYINNTRYEGIYILNSRSNTISFHTIEKCKIAINLAFGYMDGLKGWTAFNNIFKNNIINNTYGINIEPGLLSDIFGFILFNKVSMNNIINNNYGISLTLALLTTVKNNNFIGNDDFNAFFSNSYGTRWVSNYWDDWDGTGSYKIKGEIDVFYLESPFFKTIDWYNYDKNPAKEPYDSS